jgi:hypothetical protein
MVPGDTIRLSPTIEEDVVELGGKGSKMIVCETLSAAGYDQFLTNFELSKGNAHGHAAVGQRSSMA